MAVIDRNQLKQAILETENLGWVEKRFALISEYREIDMTDPIQAATTDWLDWIHDSGTYNKLDKEKQHKIDSYKNLLDRLPSTKKPAKTIKKKA